MTPHILIMAAGQGKRMHSNLPKVLHPVLFRPMIHHILDKANELPHATVSLIVGHGAEEVRTACAKYPHLQYFVQKEQLGTAHAVRMAEDFLRSQPSGQVLVLSGDVILLKVNTLKSLCALHDHSKASATLMTTKIENPMGYGRILRNHGGSIVDVREEADCSSEEKKIHEINAGIYCFEKEALLEGLSHVQKGNKQGEYYLPDVIHWMVSKGKTVSGFSLDSPIECFGINDRIALHGVENVMKMERNRELMLMGVSFQSPENTYIDTTSRLGRDVFIESGCVIVNSDIADGVVIEANSRVVSSRIGEATKIKQGCCVEESAIGKYCQVGPYAHLRPSCNLSDNVKIGNFVEIKNSTFGENSKASHLTYVGDASVGKDVNIGCGFITCNYDGFEKHRTIIEDGVFIGSDSQAVAPVIIGAGSYIAAGSTITRDVPAGALGISRGKQENKQDYARRMKKKLE